MTLPPTLEQEKILLEPGNCAVIARPGSGKTFTLSLKIKDILGNLPHYKGVIAISYTNKASDELESRCLSGGIARKGSFFGTIDKFFLTEIIIPFGAHIFGEPRHEVQIIELKDANVAKSMEILADSIDYEALIRYCLVPLKQLFLEGQILLESFGFLALYIFNSSLACRRYIKARYSHVIVDEYQDCGYWQHALFIRLRDLSVCAIAVGDLDQSIFAFAKKDPKYLAALAQDAGFRVYSLSKNHRCHSAIINYSLRLLSSASSLLETRENRVFTKHVDGSEVEVATWLDSAIPLFAKDFGIAKSNKVAILFRGRRTGNLVHQNLSVVSHNFE